MSLKICLENWAQEEKLNSIVATMAADSKMTAFVGQTVEYLKAQVEQHLATFAEINDEDDLAYYTAVQYIELKARWIQINLRLSYQAFSTGEGDPRLLLKASATTALLSELEAFVSKEYVAEIQSLLAQPIFSETLKLVC